MIAIVDYGMGNLKSVLNAFLYCGANAVITNDKNDLEKATHIIIPGVGAFEKCVTNLKQLDTFSTLEYQVKVEKKPTLGICVGLQMMATLGHENGLNNGLNWLESEVVKIESDEDNLKVPNIGWNETYIIQNDHFVLKGIKNAQDFYYVHSYYMKCKNESDIAMNYKYGNLEITAAIAFQNIFATQFHPEKSQDNGLKLIDNFIKWNP